MQLAFSPTQSDVQTALRAFLLDVLPSGSAAFEGYISGSTMTVTSVTEGTINVGDAVLGTLVTPGTIVTKWDSATGETGTYEISPPQTVGDATTGATLTTFVEVIEGQDNRVPEPIGSDFITMTLMRQERLETNVDITEDARFTGSIVNNLMTIESVQLGKVFVGSNIFGVGVSVPTIVTQFISGTGEDGTYTVQPLQSTPQNPQVLAAGTISATQQARMTFQLDVHGPNSANFAQIISTLFRDDYGFEFIQAANPAVSPLYADDPRQAPFESGEQQTETRWIIEAVMQAAQTTTIPQQFADAVDIGLVDVDAVYPAQ